jgi:hypothetical protein
MLVKGFSRGLRPGFFHPERSDGFVPGTKENPTCFKIGSVLGYRPFG